MTTKTASVAEARNNFSRIAAEVCESNREVVVFRHSKPWVRICPVEPETGEAAYEDVMASVIERGRADFARGDYMVGADAARAEVERLTAARG